jgi:hypothetical protein
MLKQLDLCELAREPPEINILIKNCFAYPYLNLHYFSKRCIPMTNGGFMDTSGNL